MILKSLLLVIFYTYTIYERKTDEEIGEELSKVLIRSAPTNLKELRFFNDFKFSLESLEKFLEEWRGRPALSILTPNSIYKGEDYIKLINKYKNDGVIKYFRCESYIFNVLYAF